VVKVEGLDRFSTFYFPLSVISHRFATWSDVMRFEGGRSSDRLAATKTRRTAFSFLQLASGPPVSSPFCHLGGRPLRQIATSITSEAGIFHKSNWLLKCIGSCQRQSQGTGQKSAPAARLRQTKPEYYTNQRSSTNISAAGSVREQAERKTWARILAKRREQTNEPGM
jgi:hypothetical protein